MTDRLVKVKLPEEHYTPFNATRENLPELIVVNDALLSFLHTEVFQWHLEVYIDAEELAENRMPTSDESKMLFEVGDAIEKCIIGKNALFLSRSTWNATRELSFRVHDPEVANALLQKMLASTSPARRWEFVMRHDPEWELAGYVFKLFPLAGGVNG